MIAVPPTSSSPNRGFTLVELLVYFALFSILLVVITNLFIDALAQRDRDSLRSSLQQESEYVLAKLRHDVLNADAIIHPALSGESSPTLELDVGGDTYTYSLDSQRLLESGPDQQSYLTSNNLRVSDFEVENRSGTATSQTVTITFTLTATQLDGSEYGSRVLSTTVTNR